MTYTKETLQEAIVQKLRLNYGCTEKQATDGEIMKACALVLRDIMAERGVRTREEVDSQEKRKVHYMSMEFLMGRSLMKNAYNLELLEPLTGAVEALGFKAADIFDMEPDAGLGNGGLGRLAACYLDSMTTLEIPATGYSICYELGIFKQKIVDGQQVELPDDWKNLGDAWLMPKPQETEEVHFGGKVRTRWDNGHLMVVHEDYTRVLAVPCDMEIAGYDELKKELDYSKTTRADEIAELIKEARGFGDLSENSEYDEAKNEQGKLYSRIAELENILLHAVIVDETDMDSDKVSIGCRVTVTNLDNGKTLPEYTIVGSQEANVMERKVSEDSPFGKALMGSKAGSEITVEAPKGVIRYRVDKIER